MKRSIHGMGQMMSTMVLNRKQSIFGGAVSRGAGMGPALVLEGQRASKDSLDNMDLTVMDTKLKILEILQVIYNNFNTFYTQWPLFLFLGTAIQCGTIFKRKFIRYRLDNIAQPVFSKRACSQNAFSL